MSKISRFVIWICKRFDRDQIERIIQGLLEALKDPNSEINSKDRSGPAAATAKQGYPQKEGLHRTPKHSRSGLLPVKEGNDA